MKSNVANRARKNRQGVASSNARATHESLPASPSLHGGAVWPAAMKPFFANSGATPAVFWPKINHANPETELADGVPFP